MEVELMGMRTRSATRNAVRWMVLFLLLQYLGSHPSFTAAGEEEEGHVVIEIVKYFNYPNSIFFQNYAGDVSYFSSDDVCHLGGGVLSADQTPAAHVAIADELRKTAVHNYDTSHAYLGGDADHAATPTTDPKKSCGRGLNLPTLNCIFKWNQGAFADSSADGLGVAFFRGTLYTLVGVGPMNGYKAYWPYHYPHHGKTFLMLRLKTRENSEQATWYDWYPAPKTHIDTPYRSFGVVCETQKGYVVSTTTLPPAVVVPWLQKNWYVVLIVVLLPVVVAVALITVCFYRCRGVDDESKWVAHMVLREINDNPLYAIDRNDGIHNKDSQMKQDLTLGDGMPTTVPSEHENAEVPTVIASQESTVYDLGDIL
ncbi:hypothetical protein C3747_32g469 [Trypanosoma cruzi]|uniref:Uncharacterized protein n=2 Tax=Trypanosoma cruzi TaxID=5693 RepID=Q4D520_TRYCC|nr:hypothetical protein, conserved [Trypanosoma cruzi]EAN87623.1 hypothetical protein, conserved [Trypanosoma cruzi]PWV14909.1 hypothetical protein C3747_32g469 [Trypanosoma cruzi]|eukprot:XP_809474.1 hypothetical protein [Trypanosoma cruzi strain CL Brener]